MFSTSTSQLFCECRFHLAKTHVDGLWACQSRYKPILEIKLTVPVILPLKADFFYKLLYWNYLEFKLSKIPSWGKSPLWVLPPTQLPKCPPLPASSRITHVCNCSPSEFFKLSPGHSRIIRPRWCNRVYPKPFVQQRWIRYQSILNSQSISFSGSTSSPA
jgi:hypothetical protein